MRVVVLFNLKAGIEPASYEAWARSRDIPGVRSLVSVDDFTIYRTTGLLGGTGPAPYHYVEILDVADRDGFFKDAASPASQAVAREFREYLDGEPIFLLTEPLD